MIARESGDQAGVEEGDQGGCEGQQGGEEEGAEDVINHTWAFYSRPLLTALNFRFHEKAHPVWRQISLEGFQLGNFLGPNLFRWDVTPMWEW